MSDKVQISRLRAAALLTIIASEYLLWGLFYSLQPPFYPQEAEAKGATPSQYSFVFGIAYLAAFLASPLFGQFGHHVGSKWLFLVGAIVQASVSILFGFLDLVEDTTAFLVLSYLLRFVYGFMDAGAMAGVVSILLKLFPSNMAFLLACTESFFGLGYSIGPAVGGLLYVWGGFQLPFVAMGILGLVLSLPVLFVVPHLKSKHAFSAKKMGATGNLASPSEIPISTILKSPDVLSPWSLSAVFFGGLGIVESLLSPHLEASGASALQVSLNFALIGTFYMISALITGQMVDRMKVPAVLSALGSFLSFVAFLFIGPSPWLEFILGGPQPNFTLGMSALLGLAKGIVVSSTFVRIKNALTHLGCDDDIRTHLRVSGLWLASFYLGNSLGPLLGGFLVEWMGFAWAIGCYAWPMLVVGLVDALEARHAARPSYRRLGQ